jgi:acetyl-CoA carboxylase biotin carboxyl carrier protein
MTSKPPFSSADLRQIAQWLEAAGLQSIEISGPGQSVRIVGSRAGRAPWGAVIEEMAPAGAGQRITRVTAEDIGVFMAAHPLRAAPFVEPGQSVRAGDIVGLLKTRDVYVPVTAPSAGVVVRIAARHGQAAGYGAALIDIETESGS